MLSLQQLADLADHRIRGVWNETNDQLSQSMEYSIFGYKDIEADAKDPQYENFSGLGRAVLTGEGQPYNREDKVQGYKVTISPQKYTKAAVITEEMLRFNLWPEINDVVASSANSVNQIVDENAAKIFYLGFGTTFMTGGDSQALFSASHPMKDGSTQSNTLGTVPLTYDNLKIARQTLDRMYDDKGVPMQVCRNLRLIVAQEGKEKAMEVLRSIGNPDSANRVSNVFANGTGSIDLKVASWIPSAYGKYWFLVDLDRASKLSKMVWGWRPRFDSDKVVNNGTKVYTASVYFQPGFQSFQHVVGSASTTI